MTLQPLGSAFIKMIRAVIGLVIFFTVVAGIGSMQNMSKVGRLGGVALVYFLALSTFALLVGLLVGVVAEPGAGFNVDAAARRQGGCRLRRRGAEDDRRRLPTNIIPSTVIEAFAKGDILAVIFVSVLFGCVLARMGDKGKPIRDLVDAATKWVFGVINLMMWAAPVGVFGHGLHHRPLRPRLAREADRGVLRRQHPVPGGGVRRHRLGDRLACASSSPTSRKRS